MVTSLGAIPISTGRMEMVAKSSGLVGAIFSVTTFVTSRAGVKIVAVSAFPIRNAPILPGVGRVIVI